MNIKRLYKKIVKIQTKYKREIEPLIGKLEQFDQISAKIPHGEYKNRWGQIMNISYSDLTILIQPYRLIGNRMVLNNVLNIKPDARTFWKLSDIKEIKEN